MTPHVKPAPCARALLRPVLPAAVLLGLTGCASQGALQPPSLHIPANVQHLSAERLGDAVELHWTTPSRTTDGVSLTVKRHSGAPFVAEICRAATALPPGPCSPLRSIPVESGEAATFRDVLTAPWSEGAARALHYRVRILNVKGRGGNGEDIVVPAGAAVPPLSALRATPAAGGGVALRWEPMAGSTGDRVMLRVVRGGAANPETLAVEPAAADPGGANDAAAKAGVAQSYTAFRTRTVTLEKQTLTLKSAPETVTVSKEALPPPPAAPAGVEAVVNTLGAPEIDLVWQPADDAGVAGYLVYRSEAGEAPVSLVSQPIRGFSYSDTDVRPGVRYRYRVAAVNANGVAGPMSLEIERGVPGR